MLWEKKNRSQKQEKTSIYNKVIQITLVQIGCVSQTVPVKNEPGAKYKLCFRRK